MKFEDIAKIVLISLTILLVFLVCTLIAVIVFAVSSLF